MAFHLGTLRGRFHDRGFRTQAFGKGSQTLRTAKSSAVARPGSLAVLPLCDVCIGPAFRFRSVSYCQIEHIDPSDVKDSP